MIIPAEVMTAIRDRASIDGNRLVLTGPRMNPRLYQQINEVLEAVGGRWTTQAGAHLFPVDAAEALAPVLETGQVVTLREKRQSAQYFPTPAPVVARLIDLAQLARGMRALEPSAGSGAIAAAAAARGAVVDCIERDPGYAALLTDTLGDGTRIQVADFLTVSPEPLYDRVVMNPPFTKGADMAHVQHALRFLKPDGLLVSVMSWAVVQHTGRTAGFRALVEARGGRVEAVAEKAFAESGTDVDTVLIAIPATRPADATPVVWPTRDVPKPAEPEFEDPAVILDEIRANLRDALAEFDALAVLLAKPVPSVTSEPRAVTSLPLPEQEQEQLSFDLAADDHSA